MDYLEKMSEVQSSAKDDFIISDSMALILNASTTPNLYSTAVSFDEFTKKNDLCCCWTKWVQRLFACEMSCESPENKPVGPLGRHLPECKK